MSLRKSLRWTGLLLGGVLAVIVVGLGAFVGLGIPVDLSGLRPPIEAVGSRALRREVKIEGPIVLAPSLTPTIEVHGVRVANPQGWQSPEFLRLELVRAGLGVLPLLGGRVQIEEVTVEGLAVNLETRGDGDVNWLFGEPEDPSAEEAEPGEGTGATALELVELRELALRGIAVSHLNGETGEVTELTFNEIIGSAVDDEPMQLAIQGAVQGQSYGISLTGGTLHELLAADSPWPLDLSASAAETNLHISGQIDEPLRGRGLDLAFTLRGAALRDLMTVFDTPLPPIESYQVTGVISEQAGTYRLSNLAGQIGQSTFSGELTADLAAARPDLSGRLDFQTIDVGPVVAAIDEDAGSEESGEPGEATDAAQATETSDATETVEDTGAEEGEEAADIPLDDQVLTLDWSRSFSADLELTVGEVIGGRVPIRDVSLKITVASGAVAAPLQVVYAEVPFQGDLNLTEEGEDPALEIQLIADRTETGDLFEALVGIPGIDGEFAQAALLFSARGQSIRGLAKTAGLDFLLTGARLSYLPEDAEQAVDFSLDKFELSVPADESMEIAAQGAILGEPISLTMTGGNFLAMYIEERWPIELAMTGSGAKLEVRGDIVEAAGGAGSTVELDLRAERIGTLEKWLGVSSEASGALLVQGRLALAETDWWLDPLSVKLGNTAGTGKLGDLASPEGSVWSLSAQFDTIDMEELAYLFPQREEKTDAESDVAFTLDIPIMPQSIEFDDADLDLAISRIKMDPADVTGVAFKSRVRDGHIDRAPIQATVVETAFSGHLGADLRGAVPTFDLDIGAGATDIGHLLDTLGVTDDIEMTVGGMNLALAIKGSSAREILTRSEITATLKDGRWTLRDANTDATLELLLPEGTFSAAPDTPIALVLDGRIETTPIKIALQTDPLGSFAEAMDRVTLGLEIEVAKAQLRLKGEALLPIERERLRFEMDLKGENFASFDELLGTSLPPLGPYSLGGGFEIRPNGYSVDGLRVRLGDSNLTGSLAVDTTGPRPNLTVDLVTQTFQLDDFDTGDWSPMDDEGEAVAEADEAQADLDAAAAARDVQALLSPEVMRSLDASLKLEVEQVLSGADELGHGELMASLADGKFTVDPLTVNVPGGSVDIGFDYEPTEAGVSAGTRAKIDQLDYGLLARRIDPASDVGGLISVEAELRSESESLDEIMNGANGHIDFAILPEDLDAGIFDLWAVNLLMAALPALDEESKSRVNCIVARFKIEDGIMTPEALLVDSTRIQASGDGTIDFKEDTIEFVLAPRAKSPQMFSASTPIKVEGSIADFEVGVGTGDIIGTVFRMTTSVVTTPFKWVFSKRVAPDGEAACAEAWARDDQAEAGAEDD